MMYGFFQGDNGNYSMTRLLAFIAVWAGVAAIILGGIAFLLKPSAEAMGIVGAGLGGCAGSGALKNAGKKLEK